jgi:hypothetical protein
MATTDDQITKVVTGRIGSVWVYEISEYELAQFEQGSAATLDLNFGIALVSLAVAGIFTLCTATSYSPKSSEFVLWTFATLGFLVGIFAIIRWKLKASSIYSLAQTVRNRATNGADKAGEYPIENVVANKLPEDTEGGG